MSGVKIGQVIGVFLAIVGVVVLFEGTAAIFPNLVTSSNNLTSAGLPLASLLSATGVLGIILGVALFRNSVSGFLGMKV